MRITPSSLHWTASGLGLARARVRAVIQTSILAVSLESEEGHLTCTLGAESIGMLRVRLQLCSAYGATDSVGRSLVMVG